MGNDLVTQKEEFAVVMKQIDGLVRSGLLPSAIKSNVQAFAIWQMGRELGIPPMHAFRSINVIKGKPTLSAELMLALVYQRVPGAKVTFKTPPEKQNVECVVEMQRPGGDAQSFRFSIEDAKRAGLRGDNWTKYPASMLRARVVSAGARAVFPDAIMGCYTPDELTEHKPPPQRPEKKVSDSRAKNTTEEKPAKGETAKPERPPNPVPAGATKLQVETLKQIQRDNHFPNDYFIESICNICGVTLGVGADGELPFGALTTKQASDVIGELKKEAQKEMEPLKEEDKLPFERESENPAAGVFES